METRRLVKVKVYVKEKIKIKIKLDIFGPEEQADRGQRQA